MWLCLDNENGTFGTGKTPSEAFNECSQLVGNSDFNECDFYEVTSPIKMKQEIVPTKVVIPTKNK